ncbi:hypothetical protein BN13_1370011 [Nostocoides jenkinsii Ben 74]|uniref:Uncharacterized protein n=1 Tax=Nostocoides jenkinsii Ben 74 TaxID=1193518 RepID=A0A077MBG6_9MICO|nr:hypothetical protein BN13_1370011 [Tetrasphaera jenkinsii Ben 74]
MRRYSPSPRRESLTTTEESLTTTEESLTSTRKPHRTPPPGPDPPRRRIPNLSTPYVLEHVM